MKLIEAVGPFFTYGRAERMYAAETLSKFQECFRSWILPQFGEQDLESVTRLGILEFRQAMTERRLSVARQYSLLAVLKVFLRFCRSVLKVPCLDPAEVVLPRRLAKRVEFLTDGEIARLLSIIPTHTYTGLRLRALIELLLSTGMRIGEALSLDRTVISEKTGEAEIIGKGGKPRTVFFSTACLGWLARYLAARRDPHPALFVTTGKEPRRLRRDDMSKLFRRLKARSGITKRLSPHLLRHTFCTSLLHRGADIMFIKELAGHRDIQTTARYYLGVDKKALKDVLRRCGGHGWADAPSGSGPARSTVDPRVVSVRDTPSTGGEPPLQLADPGPGNSGRWSPTARDRVFP